VQYDLLLAPYGGNTAAGRRAYDTSIRRALADGGEMNSPGEFYGGFVLGSQAFAREILSRIKKENRQDRKRRSPWNVRSRNRISGYGLKRIQEKQKENC